MGITSRSLTKKTWILLNIWFANKVRIYFYFEMFTNLRKYRKIVLTVFIIFFTYINIKETSVDTSRYNNDHWNVKSHQTSVGTSVIGPTEHKARYSEKDTHQNNWRWM